MQHKPIAHKRRGFWLAVSVVSMFLVGLALPQLGLAKGKPKKPKVEICHQPPGNPSNRHTIMVSENAVQGHLGHGDFLGDCADHGSQLCSDPLLSCDDGDPNTSVDVCDVAEGGCVNLPITAEGQDVSTDGANSLVITLAGNDPSGQNLTFSIEPGGPNQGTITAGPDPVQEDGSCSEDANTSCTVNSSCAATCVDGFCSEDPNISCTVNSSCEPTCLLPSITSATATYTPTVADTNDSIDFKVTNPDGGFAIATVNINGTGEADANPPAVANIEVFDVAAETIVGTPVELTLKGNAPDTPPDRIDSLTFTVVAGTGPTLGTLSSVVSVIPTEVRHCLATTDQFCETNGDCPGADTCVADAVQPPIREATVTYTPTSAVAGDEDSFEFQACDTANPTTVCSTTNATASIDINVEQNLAPDQTVQTDINQTVTFNLGQ